MRFRPSVALLTSLMLGCGLVSGLDGLVTGDLSQSDAAIPTDGRGEDGATATDAPVDVDRDGQATEDAANDSSIGPSDAMADAAFDAMADAPFDAGVGEGLPHCTTAVQSFCIWIWLR